MSDKKKWTTPGGLQLEAVWGLNPDGTYGYEYSLWSEDYSTYVILGKIEFETLRAISDQWGF